MRIIGLALAVLASAAFAPAADAYRADNRKDVQPASPSSFLVSWSGTSGAPSFWCAAGEYVIQGLGLNPATRIYRYSPPIRGRGEGILFGFDRAQAQDTGLLRLANGPGLSAAEARFLCDRRRDR